VTFSTRVGQYLRSNILGLLALFVALSGAAYAANAAPKNSVRTKSIRNAAVTNPKLAANAVTGSNVVNGSLSGADLADGSITPENLSAAVAQPTVLHSGATLRGLFTAVNQVVTPVAAGGVVAIAVISFPVPLASSPTPHVIADGDPSTADCPGSTNAPAAAPGHLCLYEGDSPGTVFNSFDDGVNNVSGASPFGTAAFFQNDTMNNAAQAYGSWAVTAP
jgi:hypothetical protein